MRIDNGLATGSFTVSGSLVAPNITGSLLGTASFATTASFALNAGGGGFPYTGSAVITGSLVVTGSLTTTGTITAQTLVVQTVTSSVSFITGSTKFGSLPSNTHQFTGSVLISGSVGIGTASPTNPVHISTTLDNDYALRVQGSTNNTANDWTGIGIAGESANTKAAILFVDIGQSFSRGKLMFALNNESNQNNATPSNAVMTLTNDGLVGIGTITPSTALEVNGTITETSSKRYKENIVTITSSLDKVTQMRGVTYTRKDTGIKEVGVIAEEINEIFPDLVIKNQEGEVESVSYGRFIALLIESTKEQQKQIDELKQEIISLKNK
jgi:hypothetical protein